MTRRKARYGAVLFCCYEIYDSRFSRYCLENWVDCVSVTRDKMIVIISYVERIVTNGYKGLTKTRSRRGNTLTFWYHSFYTLELKLQH